jgi:3-oxoacyl-[acyl-carrier protein] reductase
MSTPVSRYPELGGKVAVITGAARGIGRGIAERLAAEGMRVVAADIDEDALSEVEDSLGAIGPAIHTYRGDLSRSEDIAEMFGEAVDAFGTVDLLINDAADLKRSRLLDHGEDLLDLQFDTNIRGPYVCSQKAAAIMRAAGGGGIINISSVGGAQAHYRGLPYDVTKGAIDAMTRAMALDLGVYGIRVNAVAPGVTFTYRTEPFKDAPRYREALKGIPLQRSGTVADMAAAVAFLASDEASYITGQVLYVDGGITAQLAPPGPGEIAEIDTGMDSHAERGI